MTTKHHAHRRGAVGILVAFLLIPLFAMVAFAVDLGYVWRTDASMQNAADSAALAGASALLTPTFEYYDQSNANGLYQSSSLKATYAPYLAKYTAKTFGEYHTAGSQGVIVDTDNDVRVGFIADVTTAILDTSGTHFPNSVEVTIYRKDATVGAKTNTPLSLFVGGMFGVHSVHRMATATATLRGGIINGFSGEGSMMLPIGMHKSVYKWLTKVDPETGAAAPNAPLPTNTRSQDRFTFDVESGSGVTAGGDGVNESKVFPDAGTENTAGNFGALSLNKSIENPGAINLKEWIQNGPTAADLASWGDKGLYATPGKPILMDGKTGLDASMDTNGKSYLADKIGLPGVMPVYTEVVGNNDGVGSNAKYKVIGFVGVVIVDVNLQGGRNNKHLTVQITRVMDPTAIIESSGTPGGSATYIYQGMSLTK